METDGDFSRNSGTEETCHKEGSNPFVKREGGANDNVQNNNPGNSREDGRLRSPEELGLPDTVPRRNDSSLLVTRPLVTLSRTERPKRGVVYTTGSSWVRDSENK